MNSAMIDDTLEQETEFQLTTAWAIKPPLPSDRAPTEDAAVEDATIDNASDHDSSIANEVPTDSFAAGVASLLGLSAIQKVVGLLRTVLFCWLLTDDQLGRWSLVLAFICIAAPVAVLGLPGTFGKYVEYFRQRGQLRAFLRRTTAVCSVLAVVTLGWMLANPQQFANWIFRSQEQVSLVFSIALVMLLTITWNYLNELLTALRMIRVVALLQFVNAISFTVFGVAFVFFGEQHERAIIYAFGVANLLPVIGAIWVLAPVWRSVKGADLSLQTQDVWNKLLPFAAWVWVSNLLANTFNASSQYMIKLCADQDPIAVDSLVGQFYSSRVVPMIMVSVATYFSAVVLPYLSHDWELGRRDAIARRMNITLKMMGLIFSLVGAMVLLGAPVLFKYGLGNRYNAGMVLVPWTLAYCAWYSLLSVAQNFLWCVEKTWLACAALLAGLLANIGLNLLLFPQFGLNGTVCATAASMFLAMALVYVLSWWQGLQLDHRVWYTSVIPCLLGLGGMWGGVLLLFVIALALRGQFLLSDEEKQTVNVTIIAGWEKVKRRFLPMIAA